MAKTEPEPKRRKINQPSYRGTVLHLLHGKPEMQHQQVPVAQTSEINARIQQAKNFAVAQAQQEGCTSNFKIFDSSFGNVVPTRKELAGKFAVS